MSDAAGSTHAQAEKDHEIISEFQRWCVSGGSSPATARKYSALVRAMIREGTSRVNGLCAQNLLENLEVIAALLARPGPDIAASTTGGRLVAIHRFIKYRAPGLGMDASTTIRQLDDLLPRQETQSWFLPGTLLGGARDRRRARHPSLDVEDLHRLLDAAATPAGYRSARDRALVAALIFTGLRPSDVARLRWEQFSLVLTPGGHVRRVVDVERGGRPLRLPIISPAAEAFDVLEEAAEGLGIGREGPVFRRSPRVNSPLAARAIRDIFVVACGRAGLAPPEFAEVRSTTAWWLLSSGASEPAAMAALGLKDARALDKLVAPHRALSAQRRVSEHLDPVT
jgi:integrase